MKKLISATEKKIILIIDDSVDSQELLTTLFESIGYRVHHVSNGAEALSLLLKSPIIPDLILLDYQMPIMNGLEFRKKQLENSILQQIPVIVMTGDTNEDISSLMMSPYAVDIKPIQINRLIQSVQRCLEKQTF